MSEGDKLEYFLEMVTRDLELGEFLDYELILWDGTKRIPLKLDGIDDGQKRLVFVRSDFYEPGERG